MTAPVHVPRFHVRQKITPVVNRYLIRAAGPDGSEGEVLAFAEQKRFKLKEEVTFWADESRGRVLFSFKARQRLDVHAEHDVLDEQGLRLGSFRKDFTASLLRSTWHLSTPGLEAVGRERRLSVALLRRFWDVIPYLGEIWVPFVYHFDFVDTAAGTPVLTSRRVPSIRDRYAVEVPDPRLDFRIAASVAVALDALQSR
jgi:hypothetical protein